MPADYFDSMYGNDPDPWGFANRWYEKRKYGVTLASMPLERYASAYEPACSIGVLTLALSERCDRLLACDGSLVAVEQARERTAGRDGVQIEHRRLPEEWAVGTYDLVVLSELLYYFGDDDLALVLDHAVSSVAADGTLVAVHWRHVVADYPQTGEHVHRALAAKADAGGLARVVRHSEDDFLLDVYVRVA